MRITAIAIANPGIRKIATMIGVVAGNETRNADAARWISLAIKTMSGKGIITP
jgi:hypothetical protein